jgi:putative transposase
VRENHSEKELDMPMKKHKPEQIVTLLRQIEVEIANGKTTPQACKEAEITVQTFYRWRKEFGGLKLDQAKRLKELERENTFFERSSTPVNGSSAAKPRTVSRVSPSSKN